MSGEDQVAQAIARLKSGAVSGLLKPPAQQQAEQHLARLSRGVRVVLIGPKSSGKTQLCDVLLGVPRSALDQGVTARIFSYSPVLYETSREDPNLGKVLEVGYPSEILKRTQVIDVAGEDTTGPRIAWALSQADIVLWCAQGFDATQAQQWGHATDHLKDHSFLVLTQADRFAETGAFHERVAMMQVVAAEEFHSLFPTTTLQAHDALRAHGHVPGDQLAAGGIRALADAVMKLATSGQRADLDNALLFLERHSIADNDPSGVMHSSREADVTTYIRALDVIRNRASALDIIDPDQATAHVDVLLSMCGEVSEELVDIFSADPSTCPDIDAWRDELYAASDKLVLMGLESDLRSSSDAVAIIAQLKRDLEYRAFA